MQFRILRSMAFWFVALIVVFAGQAMSAVPAHAAETPIEQRYNSDVELRTMLGQPTGEEHPVADGSVRSFRWGSLYWSPETGVHEVHGAIRARYLQLGGPSGRLGFPTTDEDVVYVRYNVPEIPAAGARNNFTNGALAWMTDTGKTIWMSKPFADVTPYDLYPYWFDLSHDEQPAGAESRMLDAGGTAMYQTGKGFYQVTYHYHMPDDLLATYRELGMHAEFLGVPTGNVKQIAATDDVHEGYVQTFKGGRIYQCGVEWEDLCGSDQPEAFEVHGAILSRFNTVGGLVKLGYPTTNELPAPGGRISYFQHGSIFWNSTTQKTTVTYY